MNLRDQLAEAITRRQNEIDILRQALEIIGETKKANSNHRIKGGLTCEKCKVNGFSTVQALGKHKKKCDGVFRTEVEQRRHHVRKWKAQHPEQVREYNVEYQRKRRAEEAKEKPVKPIQCIDCKDDVWFKNKSELDQHRIKDHGYVMFGKGKPDGEAHI